jgi:hypothetical protein
VNDIVVPSTASSSRKTKRSTTARQDKNAARGGGPGKKATKEALLKEEKNEKKEKQLKDICDLLKLSNKIARRRLNEQQRATNVITISQAHAACQNNGDEMGAREMHSIMLQMARAAAKSHVELERELSSDSD